VRARKDVDGNAGESRLRAPGMLSQSFLGELPARERFGVTVRDADPQATDLRDKMHGKVAQASPEIRKAPRRLPQALENPVRSRNLGVAHPLGIGAAAARFVVLAGDLGLDIAPQGRVLQNGLIDLPEFRGLRIEPVEVAIEGERCVLAPCQREDRLDRERISVEAADDVKGFRLERRLAAEDARIAVAAGTGTARLGGRTSNQPAAARSPSGGSRSSDLSPRWDCHRDAFRRDRSLTSPACDPEGIPSI
jgi:hypothetical protein